MYLYRENPEPECFECLQKDNQIDDIKYWFKTLVSILYAVHPSNLEEEINTCVDELSLLLDVKFPNMSLQVVRKNQTTESFGMLDAWKIFNHQYLKTLANSGV